MQLPTRSCSAAPARPAPGLRQADEARGAVLRTDFAEQVSSFLDLAEAAGVRHVTYISAFGFDQVPPQWVAHRTLELDLIGRTGSSVYRLLPAYNVLAYNLGRVRVRNRIQGPA
jgi:hypothetical protein